MHLPRPRLLKFLDQAARRERILLALSVLEDAWDAARDLGLNAHQFALEIRELQSLGLSATDLRWLVAGGYIDHLHEESGEDRAARTFLSSKGLAFTERSCFTLATAGLHLAAQLLAGRDSVPPPFLAAEARASSGLPVLLPHWDQELRELMWGNRLVKRFRVPAVCQEIVLAALEEQKWPGRIDDPLPCRNEIDPRTRLHETIKALNRNQVHPLLCFQGDGTGQGIIWTSRTEK